MTRQIQVLVFTADVRVQVPPRPPKIKGHPLGCPFIFALGGDLLAAGLHGCNTIMLSSPASPEISIMLDVYIQEIRREESL